MNPPKKSSVNIKRLLPKLVAPTIVFAISMTAVVIYTNMLPKQYKASARIWVQPKGLGMPMASSESGSGGGGFVMSPFATGNNPLTTACEVIRSDAVVNAAQQILAAKLPADQCPDSLTISGGLDAEPVKDADIVAISYFGENAKQARQIVGAVVEAFCKENNIQTSGGATQSKVYLEKQLKDARLQYQKTRDDLRRFKEQNHAIDLEAQVAGQLEQKTSIEQLISESKHELAANKSKMAYLEKQLGCSSKDVLTFDAVAKDDELKSLRKAIAENEVKLIDLRTKYQDEHPKMKRIIEALNQSKQALASRMKAIIGRSDSGLQINGSEGDSEVRANMVAEIMDLKAEEVAATERIGSLEQDLRELNSRISVVPSQQTGLAELVRADSVASAALTAVEQELQSVNLTESVAQGSSNLQVIDPPSVTDERSNLRLLGFAASFGLALVTAAIQFVLNPRIISAKQASAILNLPTTGWIPSKPKTGGSLRYLTKGLRKLIVQMKAQCPSGTILVVTSPDPKDGKSTLCYGLAQSLAEMGSRVALVDANLYRPYQHILLKQEGSPGLSECIDQPQEHVLKFMKPILPNLAFLPAGECVDDGSISLKDTTPVLQQLRADFDFVIVDSQAAGVAFDALVLPDCDCQLVVVSRLHATKKNSLKLLAAQIQMHPEIESFSVVNDVDELAIASSLVADAAILNAMPAAAPSSTVQEKGEVTSSAVW